MGLLYRVTFTNTSSFLNFITGTVSNLLYTDSARLLCDETTGIAGLVSPAHNFRDNLTRADNLY